MVAREAAGGLQLPEDARAGFLWVYIRLVLAIVIEEKQETVSMHPDPNNQKKWRDVVKPQEPKTPKRWTDAVRPPKNEEEKIADVYVDKPELGQALYDKVVTIVETPEHARKITGMILYAVPLETIEKDINDSMVVADWVIKCLEARLSRTEKDEFKIMKDMADEFKEWLDKQTKEQANVLKSHWDQMKLYGHLNSYDKRETNLNQMEILIKNWGESDLINKEHKRILEELENKSNPWVAYIRNYMHRHILLAERDIMEMVIDKIDPQDLGQKYLQKYALKQARERKQTNRSWWFPKQMTHSLRQMVAWKKAVNATEEDYEKYELSKNGKKVLVYGAPINPYLVRFNLSTI